MDAQQVQNKLKAMERYIERYYWEVILQGVISGSPYELGVIEVMESPLKKLLWLVIGARIIKLLKVSEMEEVCQCIFLHWRTFAMDEVTMAKV